MLKISGQSDPDLQRYLTQTDRQRFLTFIERLSDLEKMLITRKGTNPRIKKTWNQQMVNISARRMSKVIIMIIFFSGAAVAQQVEQVG